MGQVSQGAQANRADTAKPGSVFSLLGVDSLSGLDPVARELAQTRPFAECALSVTPKMPMLLRWQTELLNMNSVNLLEVRVRYGFAFSGSTVAPGILKA